jgi:hypothetical protein
MANTGHREDHRRNARDKTDDEARTREADRRPAGRAHAREPETHGHAHGSHGRKSDEDAKGRQSLASC